MKHIIFRIYKGARLTVLILLIKACSPNISINEAHVFRYNEFRNITSLDPAFARNPQNIWPINQLFNGLVQLNDSLLVVPEIAHSWEIDSLGTTYTFFLREDIYYHPSPFFGEQQTRTVVADDFIYSLNRLTDPKVGSPGGWVVQQVDEISALGPHVLQIKLKQPFPAFLSLLSMKYCAVVPKEVVENAPDQFRKNPIGTGPFKFKAWEEDVKLVLRKNKNYFEKDQEGNPLPYLDAISIQFLPDIQSEFMLFSQGKLDFMNSLDPSYKDELLTPNGELQLKYSDQINMQKGPYLNTEYIGLYLESDNPALNSIDIRKAINIGFDRSKMITYLRNTIGFPALGGMIPHGLVGKTTKSINSYQPNLARKLVNDYTNRHHKKPKLRIATDVNYIDICEFLQRELEKIGIEIIIDLMPTAALRQAKSAGKLEAFRASWIADYPDAENYLSLFYGNNFSPSGPNYTHFKSALFDSLYNRAFEISDLKERVKLYKKMDELAMEQYPIIPLYYDQAVRFTQKKVEGFSMNPLNMLDLKKVWKKKD